MNQHGEIILYQTRDGQTKLDVRFEDETVWLTQQAEAMRQSILKDAFEGSL